MHYVFHFLEDFDRLQKFVFFCNFTAKFPIVMFHLKWIIDNFSKGFPRRYDGGPDRNGATFVFPANRWTKKKLAEEKSKLWYGHFDTSNGWYQSNEQATAGLFLHRPRIYLPGSMIESAIVFMGNQEEVFRELQCSGGTCIKVSRRSRHMHTHAQIQVRLLAFEVLRIFGGSPPTNGEPKDFNGADAGKGRSDFRWKARLHVHITDLGSF